MRGTLQCCYALLEHVASWIAPSTVLKGKLEKERERGREGEREEEREEGREGGRQEGRNLMKQLCIKYTAFSTKLCLRTSLPHTIDSP